MKKLLLLASLLITLSTLRAEGPVGPVVPPGVDLQLMGWALKADGAKLEPIFKTYFHGVKGSTDKAKLYGSIPLPCNGVAISMALAMFEQKDHLEVEFAFFGRDKGWKWAGAKKVSFGFDDTTREYEANSRAKEKGDYLTLRFPNDDLLLLAKASTLWISVGGEKLQLQPEYRDVFKAALYHWKH